MSSNSWCLIMKISFDTVKASHTHLTSIGVSAATHTVNNFARFEQVLFNGKPSDNMRRQHCVRTPVAPQCCRRWQSIKCSNLLFIVINQRQQKEEETQLLSFIFSCQCPPQIFISSWQKLNLLMSNRRRKKDEGFHFQVEIPRLKF